MEARLLAHFAPAQRRDHRFSGAGPLEGPHRSARDRIENRARRGHNSAQALLAHPVARRRQHPRERNQRQEENREDRDEPAREEPLVEMRVHAARETEERRECDPKYRETDEKPHAAEYSGRRALPLLVRPLSSAASAAAARPGR